MRGSVTSGRRGTAREGRLRLAAVIGLLVAIPAVGVPPTMGADAETPTAWDYRTIYVVWDDQAQDWRADWNDGTNTVGLEAVLDNEGDDGWELIEVANERFDPVVDGGATSQEARRLRLILKRPASSPVAATPFVAISGFSFQPASLEIAAGATVTWENQDAAPHTVTAVDGSFDSGQLLSGASFDATFEQPGTFDYACAIHPSMTGTIVVS